MTEYISREAAIAEMNAEGYTKNMRVHKRILAIPASNVRPVVRGKWIKDSEDGPVYCSECGEEHEWLDFRASFCDNCGADMREVSE